MNDDRDFLPARPTETDDEIRLREALNRQCAQLMRTLDSAVRLRSLPQDGKRHRAVCRAHLIDFCMNAMAAMAHSNAGDAPHIRTENGQYDQA